jgi:hypothetical protein
MGRAERQPHPAGQRTHAARDAARSPSDLLESDDSGDHWTFGQGARRCCRNQEQMEPEFKALVDVLCSCLAQAEDTAHSLHGWMRNTDLDPSGSPNWMSECRMDVAGTALQAPARICQHCWQVGNQRAGSLDAAAIWPHWKRTSVRRWLHSWQRRSASQAQAHQGGAANWPRPSPRPCKVLACKAAVLK